MKNKVVDFKDYTVHEGLIVESNQEIPRAGEGSAVLLKDGSIMLAYSQFSGKADHDSAIIVSRISKDGGITWSGPANMIEKSPDALNVMSTSFLRLHDGRIAFLYAHKFAKNDCIPYICFSNDEGKSWSKPFAITERGKYYVVNNDRLVQTKGGRLLVPACLHEYREEKYDLKGACGVFYSDDDGSSWEKSGKFISIKNENVMKPRKIANGKEEIWKEILQRGVCSQEPGVIELADGRIMMWARTYGGYMYKAVSEDGGESWSEFSPVSQIVSPCGPQSIKRVPGTSKLICVYNDHGAYSFAEDNWWNWRTPLSIAVSGDEGENWSVLGNIEDTSHNYCYTSILFFEDKTLLTYYVSENSMENGIEKRRNLASLKVKAIRNSAF
ncbi:MAG: hypothetical protein A2017_13690 [Lentisphaerae bacterium GWF2_44_16]|nr:MAG: hypothetical protein A2017_13690 [Lentisphaerae bacterium GWF2_44_16]